MGPDAAAADEEEAPAAPKPPPAFGAAPPAAARGVDGRCVHHHPRRIARTSPRLKRALGKWAYVAAAVAQKRRAHTPDLVVTTNKEELRCRLAICANAARYGGDYVIAPQTCATRPGLALVVVTDDSLLALLRIGWRMLSGGGLNGAGVRILDVSEATLAVAQGNEAQEAAAQVDGDPFGVTPVRAVCAEAPVRLVVAG